MVDMQIIWLCAKVNFQKWPSTPRIYTLFILISAFVAYHLRILSNFAADMDLILSPWIFPHLLSLPAMHLVFSCFTILLFCNAPFVDNHTPFLINRSGRKNWIIGQIIYIMITAFIYTIFVCLLSALVLIPNVKFTTEWGSAIYTLALEPHLAPLNLGLFISDTLILRFSAIQATLISSGLFWIVSTFIGILIFTFNTIFKKASGLVVSSFFVFMILFAMYLGRITLGIGEAIFYLSPFSWWNMLYLDWDFTGAFPSPIFAVTILSLSNIVMSLITIKVFCKKDLDFKGGQ